MNKDRRKALRGIFDRLQDIKDDLESLRDDEDAFRNGIPENLINSDRYNVADQAIDNMNEALDGLDTAIASVVAAAE